MTALVAATSLPNIHFRIKTFERRILGTDEANALLHEWTPAILHVSDAYGGRTRSVVVRMASTTDMVFLKCVESLAKREFEDLFGFGCGRFVSNRVITFARDVLCF